MGIWKNIKGWFRSTTDFSVELDREGAASRIRNNIWFRGANVWILAFSIVIASVGLNVNSTAVIIGAMLISPLMGPIIGMGFSMGTFDGQLMKDALRNLLIMFLVSLAASAAYFFISPLSLVDPTELEARTSPTIYDVLIALFGGLAGMLENSRSERGTVLSGVAIATALMPPLCTAGYGLAHANAHFFFGALFLFLINTVFIIMATYVMTKFLRFEPVAFIDVKARKRTRNIMTVVMLLILVPSTISAVQMVRVNQFEQKVQQFVKENRIYGGRYMYDYKVNSGWTPTADIYLTGDPLNENEKDILFRAAWACGVEKERLTLHEQNFGAGKAVDYEAVTRDFFQRYEQELAAKDARIESLEGELSQYERAEFDYLKIAREVQGQFPGVREFTLGRGARVIPARDSLEKNVVVTAFVDAAFKDPQGFLQWLKIRLDAENVTLYLTGEPAVELPQAAPDNGEWFDGSEEAEE